MSRHGEQEPAKEDRGDGSHTAKNLHPAHPSEQGPQGLCDFLWKI